MREIARGGMGRIQVARDRRLGRDVAVKEMLQANGSAARRFEREARITARLQHPSIVSVHEAGVWPSGEPFYAMRLVSGRSLDEAIAAAGSYEARLALLPNVLAVADAMAYAHGERVIHRDLKPRNVVVGDFGETVVIDWGLAKELDANANATLRPDRSEDGAQPNASISSQPGETTAGELLGTPLYMPPEQAMGEAVDERADVYAIGAILYHVLAGVPSYKGASNAEVLSSLHAGPPLAIAAVAPSAPRELVAIVERAMARDPAARYPTARALADDLRRFQNGQLVGAHRYSLRQLIWRWARRHRTAIAAATAAMVAAIAIGVFALTRIFEANQRAEDQRALAVKNQQGAEEILAFMLGDLRKKLYGVGRLDLMDAVANKVIAYYDAREAAATDEDLFLSAKARGAIAAVYSFRGDQRRAQAELEKERALLAPVVARRPDVLKYRLELALARISYIDLELERGELVPGVAACRALAAELEPLLAAHPADDTILHLVARVGSDIGWILEHQGDIDAAIAQHRHVLDLVTARKPSNEDNDHDQLKEHASLGNLSAHKSDYAAALTEYRLGLDISAAHVAADPTNARWIEDLAVSHKEVGVALAHQHDLAGALREHRASLALVQRLVELEPANISFRGTLEVAHEQIGIVLFEQHDVAGALEHYRASYDIAAELAAADPGNLDDQRGLSVALNKLGDVQLATHDRAAALDSYRHALAIREKLIAKDPTNTEWRRDVFYSHYKVSTVLRETQKRH